MRYTLIYCKALNIFALTYPTGRHRTLSEAELTEQMAGNETLLRWKQMCMDNPDTYVDFQMLPS